MSELRVPFAHNLHVGRYWLDFVVFDRMVIECDGKYWHKDRKDKDAKRDRFLHDHGNFVYHLDEDRINADPYGCIKTVLTLYDTWKNMPSEHFQSACPILNLSAIFK